MEPPLARVRESRRRPQGLFHPEHAVGKGGGIFGGHDVAGGVEGAVEGLQIEVVDGRGLGQHLGTAVKSGLGASLQEAGDLGGNFDWMAKTSLRSRS